ncbi:MAG: hypothetical protein QXP42_01970 [Candidatus Micrarchaeia archaeon]
MDRSLARLFILSVLATLAIALANPYGIREEPSTLLMLFTMPFLGFLFTTLWKNKKNAALGVFISVSIGIFVVVSTVRTFEVVFGSVLYLIALMFFLVPIEKLVFGDTLELQNA